MNPTSALLARASAEPLSPRTLLALKRSPECTTLDFDLQGRLRPTRPDEPIHDGRVRIPVATRAEVMRDWEPAYRADLPMRELTEEQRQKALARLVQWTGDGIEAIVAAHLTRSALWVRGWYLARCPVWAPERSDLYRWHFHSQIAAEITHPRTGTGARRGPTVSVRLAQRPVCAWTHTERPAPRQLAEALDTAATFMGR